MSKSPSTKGEYYVLLENSLLRDLLQQKKAPMSDRTYKNTITRMTEQFVLDQIVWSQYTMGH